MTVNHTKVKVLVTHSCLTFCNLMTVARQAPLSMEFSRQEYWSGQPFPFPGDFLTQGLNLSLLHCRQILYPLTQPRKPKLMYLKYNSLQLQKVLVAMSVSPDTEENIMKDQIEEYSNFYTFYKIHYYVQAVNFSQDLSRVPLQMRGCSLSISNLRLNFPPSQDTETHLQIESQRQRRYHRALPNDAKEC